MYVINLKLLSYFIFPVSLLCPDMGLKVTVLRCYVFAMPFYVTASQFRVFAS